MSTLVDAWAPMFAVSLSVPRAQMEAMSVPDLVDHVDYWAEVKGVSDG